MKMSDSERQEYKAWGERWCAEHRGLPSAIKKKRWRIDHEAWRRQRIERSGARRVARSQR